MINEYCQIRSAENENIIQAAYIYIISSISSISVSRTTGGNGRGSRCIFPFRYINQLYTSCITVNNDNKPWCAVTNDYDRDFLWGNCICGSDNTRK